MGAAGVPLTHQQPNGVKLTNGEGTNDTTQYERILNLREEVFAGKHPRLKVPSVQMNAEEPSKKVVNNSPSSAMPSSRLQNGVHNPLPPPPAPAPPPSHQPTQFQATHTKPTESKNSRPPVPNISSFSQKPLNTMSRPTSGSGPAAIDPIFLTKSEVLVKAELQQKRQRIERALEEQLNQTNGMARMKFLPQDAVLDFNVADVWRKAQEIVKPFRPVESNAANRTASASDSFDENTFYSSQMNESTTEEAEEATKPRSNKACKYYVDGHCRFGDDCTFSHDVAVKPNLIADVSQPINVDGVNADEQANLRPQGSLHQDDSKSQTHLSRIAELEEQIRMLKSQQNGGTGPEKVTNSNPSQQHRKIPEEQPYSPPDVGDFSVSQHAGRDEISDRGRVQRRGSVEPKISSNVQPPSREYGGQRQRSQSPLNEVRVIRNHITSPVAPQPARVSPLAVTKVSQIPQGLENLQESDRPLQGSGREVGTAGQSPHVFSQPASSRKRRREADSYDKTRHVLARREVVSPEIHIKAEPVSPPLHSAPAEILQPRRRQVVSRPVYIDSDPPRQGDRQTVIYQPKDVDYRISQAYSVDERRPLTPVARRIISRNGHRFDVHEEQDLRRVVSARQLRAPRSPPEHYAIPQPSSARAASHVYIPQAGQVLGRQAGMSVQPLSISQNDRDRSFSPPPRSNLSPTSLRPVAMAPPRRIVIDQYGQKYYEAPTMSDRQGSVIPLVRANEFVPRYEPHLARSTAIRDPQAIEVYDERQYRRRAPSPLSPRFIEYHSDPKPRQLFDGETGQTHGGEAYVPRTNETRMIDQPEPRSLEHFDDAGRPRENFPRTQSVRPAGGPFEESHERIARVQSVRPEQERIIDLERRSEITPYRSRHVSIREDDAFARPSRGGFERPKYRYTPEVQERRYVEEFRNEDVVFEAPPGLGRRPVERL